MGEIDCHGIWIWNSDQLYQLLLPIISILRPQVRPTSTNQLYLLSLHFSKYHPIYPRILEKLQICDTRFLDCCSQERCQTFRFWRVQILHGAQGLCWANVLLDDCCSWIPCIFLYLVYERKIPYPHVFDIFCHLVGWVSKSIDVFQQCPMLRLRKDWFYFEGKKPQGYYILSYVTHVGCFKPK